MKNLYVDESFVDIDYTVDGLPLGEYENCLFKDCIFTNVQLNGCKFSECTFESCNLSNTKLDNTSIRDVKFLECKMLGLHFEDCNQFLFSATFDHCTLNLSSFYCQNIKKCCFKSCSFIEVDFTQTDMSGLIFDHCDFSLAVFDQTNLERTDFRTSFHYVINMEINSIKKAKFSKDGLIG